MVDRTTQKEFTDQLAEYAIAFRAAIEARVDGFDPDPEASAARAVRALDDFEFFAETYFPHYIRDPDRVGKSVFQEWLISELPDYVAAADPSALAVAAPRGEAKSTYMLIFALWLTLKKAKRYIIYIMDSYEQAAVVVEAFKAELEVNPRLKMDFPKAFGRGRIWREGECVTANDVKFHARGAGQKIRGLRHGAYRPDVVFLDDIENDENVKTPSQRDKLQDWLNKAVMNLGEAGAKFDIFFIGTILHFDSVLARTQKTPFWKAKTFQAIIEQPVNMDLWESWEELVRNDGPETAQEFYDDNAEAMEAGAVVSWPLKRPLLALMKLKVKDAGAFNSEYQNMPSDANGMFARLTYWVHETPGRVYFGACDPSLGKKGNTGRRGGDPSAILVGAFDRSAVSLDIEIADIKRRVPGKIIDDIIHYQKQFSCALWFFESVQFQEFLRQQLITEAGRAGVPLPAMPVIPSTDKDLRIQSLSIPVHDARIRVHASQKVLIEQLQQYPNADHDDGPDALEMLWSGAVKNAARGEFTASGARTLTPGARMGGIAQGGILGRIGKR